MLGYFPKVFGPINSETIESFELDQSPDWTRIDPHLETKLSKYGNLLPSKKVAPPKGKLVDDGLDFTMNYMNVFFVLPSVTMREADNNRVKVTYLYKAPWKWAQYYWMGFCTVLFILAILFSLLGLMEGLGSEASIIEVLGLTALGLFPGIIGALFLTLALYFRHDLMGKAKLKVADFIKILNESPK